MLLTIIKYTVIEVAKYYYMDYIKTRLKKSYKYKYNKYSKYKKWY